jgi:hypothetical protein
MKENEWFDGVSRILASQMPRRQVFRLIAGGLAGAGLANMGIKPARSADVCPLGNTCPTRNQCCIDRLDRLFCCATNDVCCTNVAGGNRTRNCCPKVEGRKPAQKCCLTPPSVPLAPFCCTASAAQVCCSGGRSCCEPTTGSRISAIRSGPPVQIEVEIRDYSGKGFMKISVVRAVNATVKIPNFPPGTTYLDVTATKIDQSKPAQVVLEACTISRTCPSGSGCCKDEDPVITNLELTTGRWVRQTFADIPSEEHYVTIQNSNLGLKKLEVKVNAQMFKLNGLRNNEERTIDVASAMKSGTNNTISLTGYGKPGDSAIVIIADVSGAGTSVASAAATSQRPLDSDSLASSQGKSRHPRHALVWGNLVSEDEEGISSLVRLKSITAHAASQSVELIFTGPLAAKYVGPILPGYEVMVNDRFRALVQRVYQPNASSIVLVLPSGALRPGDRVSVSWYNLKDAWERPLDPGTFIIMAR